MNNHIDGTKKALSSLSGILFILFFIGSIIAMCVFAAMGRVAECLLIFGGYFLVFGGLAIYSTKFKNAFPYVVFIIGLVIACISAYYIWGEKLFENVSYEAVTAWIEEYGILLGTALLFFAFGAVLVLFGTVFSDRKKKRCTQEVSAVCVNVKSHMGNNSGKRLYAPVYEYFFNGEICRTESNFYTNFDIPKKDEEYIIYINPNKPSEFYMKDNKVKFIMIAMGLIFMMSAAAIVLGGLGYFG